jgi:two-component system sensor histidine kinase BaeS
MIRFTIERKVFLAIFALSTTLIVLLAFAMRWNLGLGFERYTSAVELSRFDWLVHRIENRYAVHGNWDFLRAEPERVWRRLTRPVMGPPQDERGGKRLDLPSIDNRASMQDENDQNIDHGKKAIFGDETGHAPPPPPPILTGEGYGSSPGEFLDNEPPDMRPVSDQLHIRLGLQDADGKQLAGDTKGPNGAERLIHYQNKIVARLTMRAVPSSAQDINAIFLSSQTKNIALAGLIALLLSLLAAWWLTRHLLEPIEEIASGAHRIAEGVLDTRIPVRRDDELGELAHNFNIMAERLAKVEVSRRAWISDTSHELRTPLAVLRAEIEAMQDGVRTPDAATLLRLHKQVLQLTKLVDDLRLTLYHEPGVSEMEHLSPVAVLVEMLAIFKNRFATANIKIETFLEVNRIIPGDAGQLTQVYTNLLENTLRYTDAGGRLRISARNEAQRLTIQFDDTAPAPSKAALPHLFERFFRAEASRSRLHGGTGLGLAICKTLIEAHGGSITASLSDLGGLSIYIIFPLDEK